MVLYKAIKNLQNNYPDFLRPCSLSFLRLHVCGAAVHCIRVQARAVARSFLDKLLQVAGGYLNLLLAVLLFDQPFPVQGLY